jgi:hypothetical protein
VRCRRLNSTETVSSQPSVKESDTVAERGISSAAFASVVMDRLRFSLSESTISRLSIQSALSALAYSMSTVISEKGMLVSIGEMFSPPAPATMTDELANSILASTSAFCLT